MGRQRPMALSGCVAVESSTASAGGTSSTTTLRHPKASAAPGASLSSTSPRRHLMAATVCAADALASKVAAAAEEDLWGHRAAHTDSTHQCRKRYAVRHPGEHPPPSGGGVPGIRGAPLGRAEVSLRRASGGGCRRIRRTRRCPGWCRSPSRRRGGPAWRCTW